MGLALALGVFIGTGLATAGTPKRILLLRSFDAGHEPETTFIRLLRSALVDQIRDPLEVAQLSLETASLLPMQKDGPLVDYLRAILAQNPADLIVTTSGPAARFVQRNRRELFANVPVLFAGVDKRHIVDSELSSKDAVVPVHIEIPRLIDNILEVLPDTTNVTVIAGNSAFEKFWIDVVRAEAKLFSDRISFSYVNDLSLAQIEQRVAALPPRSALLYLTFYMDKQGIDWGEDRVLTRLHALARAPIFGVFDFQIGQGVVGGSLISVER
jgi:hypothetical protein